MNNTPIIPFPEQPARFVPHTPHAPMAALPGGKKRQLPKLFEITYTVAIRRLRETHRFWGVQFPNGIITLENGVIFADGLVELQDHFHRVGDFAIRWVKIMEIAEEE